jgi:hypothetical protein
LQALARAEGVKSLSALVVLCVEARARERGVALPPRARPVGFNQHGPPKGED